MIDIAIAFASSGIINILRATYIIAVDPIKPSKHIKTKVRNLFEIWFFFLKLSLRFREKENKMPVVTPIKFDKYGLLVIL